MLLGSRLIFLVNEGYGVLNFIAFKLNAVWFAFLFLYVEARAASSRKQWRKEVFVGVKIFIKNIVVRMYPNIGQRCLSAISTTLN